MKIGEIEYAFGNILKKLDCKASSVYLNAVMWNSIIPELILKSDRFTSRNHFVRCAINNLVREEIQRINKEEKDIAASPADIVKRGD